MGVGLFLFLITHCQPHHHLPSPPVNSLLVYSMCSLGIFQMNEVNLP